MIQLQVPKVRNKNVKEIEYDYVTEPVYTVYDFPYEKKCARLKTCAKHVKKGKQFYQYYNVPVAFDIETTSVEPPYKLDKKGKKVYDYDPYGFMYHWQFCLVDTVIFGRTWEEFILLLENLAKYLHLNKSLRLVIWCHNLSFEFQFIKEFIHIQSIFAREKRKVLTVLTDEFIEFRCSYFLSNMTLAKFCENSELCYYYKMVDTYDYRKFRTPETPLTETEQQYCYLDVRGLCQCIATMLQDDTMARLPLTNTGFVRRSFRKAMQKNYKNWYILQDSRLTPHLYDLLHWMFRGGNTHASRFFANTILSNLKSKDLQSSYPAAMMYGKYPMGQFTEIKDITQREFDRCINNDHACIIHCRIINPRVKPGTVVPYIDIAHCKNTLNIINDNGRVLSADELEICINEIDYQIIKRTYDHDGIKILEFYHTLKEQLPDEFRIELMKWYEKKTELKDIIEFTYEYLKSKNRVNSAYGMMVTDMCHTTVNYDAEEMLWYDTKPDTEHALDIYYSSKNSFLAYQWGVWVTSIARGMLQITIDILGMDLIYTDTDSVKYINPQKYDKVFEDLNARIIKQCMSNDIRSYSERDGKKYYLGIWDDDGEYIRFKTLGAKKYCNEHYNKKGELVFEITVAGMNKKKGAMAVGQIENFNIGKKFENVGRTTSWFNDEKPHEITEQGCTFTTASNIAILDTTYTLGVSKEYWELICDNMDKEEELSFLENLY